MVKNGEIEEIKTTLFLGEYQPNITPGGRLALPKKIREVLNNSTVVLSRGFENCIFGYTKKDWVKESEKVLTAPSSDKKARMLKRYMFSGAYELEFDSQGRTILPKTLMEYSKLKEDSEVILIGAGDHFEIWNKSLWEQSFENIEEQVLDA
jgi:MraZ protein